MNFAIIDDDKTFAKGLQRYINEFCNKKEIISSVNITHAETLLLSDEAILRYDVILLDIEMPEISGIDLADRINSVKGANEAPYIIFVSGRDNLVFDALSKFPYSFIRKSHLEDLDICISNIWQKLSFYPTYSIKTGRDIKTFEIKNIIYLEKQGNYTAFITSAGIFSERSSIDEKYRDLRELGFLRPHIGFLVNAAHITDFSGNSLTLSCGKEITISRNYKQSIKSDFNEWLVKTK